MRLIASGLFITAIVVAQQPGDELVTVPKKYVSQQGVEKAAALQKVDSVSSYAGMGKEIGIATREALNGVVDVSDKFSKTDIGHFVMFMVAWKILGQKALAVTLGIPIFLAGIGLWVYLLKGIMMPYRVLVKEDKAAKTKEYGSAQFKFASAELRACTGLLFAGSIVAWCIAWIIVIFG